MRYRSAGAFRQALEERLRNQSLGTNQTLTRLRKMVAFDRFLARLAKQEPETWIIKGGFALQLRLGDRARTTKDIDVAVTESLTQEETTTRLREAASLDRRDWFEFEVGEPTEAATGAPARGLRFPIQCLLDGRSFEPFHLDVGFGDPILDTPEKITGPRILDFAGIVPATVRCYPLTTQIAEKLHAYTREYAGGPTSRARDLADIVLAASLTAFSGLKLRRAIEATFQARGTHPIPERMPEPPIRLSASYRKLARELDLPWPTVKEAGVAAADFLNPVLKNNTARKWDPAAWKWK